MYLDEALHHFRNLPDLMLQHYKARPLISESDDLLWRCRNAYDARAVWLDHLLFNYDSDVPAFLKQEPWSLYESFAIADRADLDLCRATRARSTFLKELSFSTPHLWLACKTTGFLKFVILSNLSKCLRIPDLPGNNLLKGKDEIYQEYLSQSELREDLGLPLETVSIDKIEDFCMLSVVLTEARKIAYHDPKFEDEIWNPYWTISDGVVNQVRKNDQFQVNYLFQDSVSWNLHQGAKGKKLPAVKDFSPKRGRGRPPKSNKQL
ncbi:MAG: hypothetical protein WBB28_15865 [Crinalium sp.]